MVSIRLYHNNPQQEHSFRMDGSAAANYMDVHNTIAPIFYCDIFQGGNWVCIIKGMG